MERIKIDNTEYEFDGMDLIGEDDLEAMFEESMEDCLETVTICGYEYSQIEALKQLDETAYRQEFLAWLDMMQTDDILVETPMGFILKDDLCEVEEETEEEGE